MTVDTPDFLIVGAMKSGTTSLVFHLRNHPGVAIPPHEVHYFDNEANFAKGPGWYRGVLQKHVAPTTKVVGDKTVTYSYQPEAAPRIHDFCPNAKLVWIFREPVARAYSNYIHAYRDGSTALSFQDAVAREPELLKESIFHGYMKRSRYAEQVERFLEFFDREQMLFMLFEDFVADPEGELNRLFDFIGVACDAFEFRDEPRGQTVFPRWQRSVYWARKVGGRGPLYKLVRFLNLVGKRPGYQKLSKDVLGSYRERFTEDNARLAELTGLDLSAWAKR